MSSLSLTQQQRLQTKLSPSQIQEIRLLELPACDLQQRINEELQENPALEEGRDPEELQEERFEEDLYGEDEEYKNPLQTEDFNYDDYVNDDETPDYMFRQSNYSPDDDQEESVMSSSTSLLEHLKSQIYLTKMDKPQRHIAKWVIGNIDDDGFLRRTTEQLVDDIAFQEGIIVSEEEMADIVAQIKRFDPPGIASADLQECLLAQLEDQPESEARDYAIAILYRYFKEFSKHHFDHIKERLEIDDDQLKDAIDVIIHLNQKPANGYKDSIYETRQSTIIPDFYVENRDGDLVLTTNTGDIPELHVSNDYLRMLKDYSDSPKASKESKEAARFIKNKVDSASWFIEAIRQRNETLNKTMSAIIQQQREFFLEGDEACIKPMKMQDIADITGYDVSTISRVCNSKYVQTEFGIFSLKHFFAESMTNMDGETVSNREIKKVLSELIASEDKNDPLNDDALVALMAEHGYKVARRTIAKYRDLLGIPVARIRRNLA